MLVLMVVGCLPLGRNSVFGFIGYFQLLLIPEIHQVACQVVNELDFRQLLLPGFVLILLLPPLPIQHLHRSSQ